MLTRHIVGIQILSNYTVFLKLICQLYLKKKKKRENTLIFLPCDPILCQPFTYPKLIILSSL